MPFEPLRPVEQAAALDKVSGALAGPLNRLLSSQPLRDLLHGVPYGHPLHPALVQVPIGCWTSAGLLDLVAPCSEPAATVLVAAGLAGAAPAAVAGWTDWTALHPEQQRVGLVHAAANTVAIACYGVSLLQRLRGRRGSGAAWAFAGLSAATTGGYLGGHLAYRQAAGTNHAERVPHVVPTDWMDVAALDDLPDGVPVERQVGRAALMVLRQGEQVHALADECSHLSAPLHEGELTVERGEQCLRCPWHGSVFRLRDGAVVHGPATSPMPVWQTRVSDGRVSVRLEGAG